MSLFGKSPRRPKPSQRASRAYNSQQKARKKDSKGIMAKREKRSKGRGWTAR